MSARNRRRRAARAIASRNEEPHGRATDLSGKQARKLIAISVASGGDRPLLDRKQPSRGHRTRTRR
jgi:hypothetical protein